VFIQDRNVVFGARDLPASNAGPGRRADDNAGHLRRAETLLDAELISRCGAPRSQHR
jgi:hypothetical protein